jgi:3'-phosphoadenosine 5'-phosphosulfate sulfotransferase (PAPS reductase)/FAD synthetase
MRKQPDLASYDWILVNSSAGKDSQAMLDVIVELARDDNVVNRVVVVHCDLGRVEWPGTRELAERQAAHYGVRFEVVRRPQGDLLAQVEQRHASLVRRGKIAPPWPSPTRRWCTSDQKRAQVRTLMTRLARESCKPPCKILNCMGMRADESAARAKLAAFEHDDNASNGRRHVDTWLPLHAWTTEQVWARIRASGVRYHPAYDLGMGRLSCVLCIYAPERQLMLAAEHNRALLDEYVEVEQRVGFAFRKGTSLTQIRRRLNAGERGRVDASGGCWDM